MCLCYHIYEKEDFLMSIVYGYTAQIVIDLTGNPQGRFSYDSMRLFDFFLFYSRPDNESMNLFLNKRYHPVAATSG